jgi:serine/threonine protein kinase
LDPRESLFLFYQILKGLQGLRDVGIIFKGLKSCNVMCFYKGSKLRLKIGDFGYNKPLTEARLQKVGKILNLYAPPEVLDP